MPSRSQLICAQNAINPPTGTAPCCPCAYGAAVPAVPGSAPACRRSVTFASLAASISPVTASRYRRRPFSTNTARRGSPSSRGGYTVILHSSRQAAGSRKQAADPPATHPRRIPRSAPPFPDRNWTAVRAERRFWCSPWQRGSQSEDEPEQRHLAPLRPPGARWSQHPAGPRRGAATGAVTRPVEDQGKPCRIITR